MKKKISCLLLALSMSAVAKSSDPLCNGVTGGAFTTGDGSVGNPYLICTKEQVQHIAQDTTLLVRNYRVGADIDFKSSPFLSIGSAQSPFQGNLNGDGHTWYSLTVPKGSTQSQFLAPFAYIKNGSMKNLNFTNVTIPDFIGSGVGGVVARAENSTFDNIHVTNLDIKAPDHSGGLIGDLVSSTLTNSSCKGQMSQWFGTDGSGGLVGTAINSTISSCFSGVNLVQVSEDPFGVSAIGGLVGSLANSTVTNCAVRGKIDYSFAKSGGPHCVGGLFGTAVGSTISFAYFAAPVSIQADNLGGIVGCYAPPVSPVPDNVFWDTQLSGVPQSPLGTGFDTSTLTTASFWQTHNFDSTIWFIADGIYPELVSSIGH